MRMRAERWMLIHCRDLPAAQSIDPIAFNNNCYTLLRDLITFAPFDTSSLYFIARDYSQLIQLHLSTTQSRNEQP